MCFLISFSVGRSLSPTWSWSAHDDHSTTRWKTPWSNHLWASRPPSPPPPSRRAHVHFVSPAGSPLQLQAPRTILAWCKRKTLENHLIQNLVCLKKLPSSKPPIKDYSAFPPPRHILNQSTSIPPPVQLAQCGNQLTNVYSSPHLPCTNSCKCHQAPQMQHLDTPHPYKSTRSSHRAPPYQLQPRSLSSPPPSWLPRWRLSHLFLLIWWWAFDSTKKLTIQIIKHMLYDT